MWQVYRMAAADIGCSLAEAAEAPAYAEYLAAAAKDDAPALHVVYINTSLRTKALAHAQVPTITCTSSNVVQTVLQVRFHNLSACAGLRNPRPAQYGADCGASEMKPALPQENRHCPLQPDCRYRLIRALRCYLMLWLSRRHLHRCQTSMCTMARTPTWAATWPSCCALWRSSATRRLLHCILPTTAHRSR